MVSPTRLTVEGKTEIGLCHTDHHFRFGAKIVLGVHIFPLLDISFETFVAKPCPLVWYETRSLLQLVVTIISLSNFDVTGLNWKTNEKEHQIQKLVPCVLCVYPLPKSPTACEKFFILIQLLLFRSRIIHRRK